MKLRRPANALEFASLNMKSFLSSSLSPFKNNNNIYQWHSHFVFNRSLKEFTNLTKSFLLEDIFKHHLLFSFGSLISFVSLSKKKKTFENSLTSTSKHQNLKANKMWHTLISIKPTSSFFLFFSKYSETLMYWRRMMINVGIRFNRTLDCDVELNFSRHPTLLG